MVLDLDMAGDPSQRASAWRISPARQPVLFSPILTGAGIRPVFTRLHTVAGEQAKSPQTTGSLTNAESGRESNPARAAGSAVVDAALGVDFIVASCLC